MFLCHPILQRAAHVLVAGIMTVTTIPAPCAFAAANEAMSLFASLGTPDTAFRPGQRS